ncbi:MAG: glycosyltransferase family 9 protein [Armatimonadetes bacterium]|nr:glycosyltransferase family 9 protein [Armatimonadota bacterium]
MASLNILIARLSSLGDVVCTLPVAASLRTSFPECHIKWVVDPRFAGILECCPAVDEIVTCKPSFSPSSLPSFKEPFDLALDMQGLSKSALVVGRARAARKLGYHWQREIASFYSQRVLPDPSSLHVVDQYVDVIRAAGAEASKADFGLIALDDDRERMKALLSEHGVTGPFVVMNAGAGWATKRWPPSHFATLIEMLASKGVQSVLIGTDSAADVAAASEVVAACPTPVVNLLGKTSIRELVALIHLSNAHVGGDTGSTHIAAALSVPAIGLYSITKPARSCPYGQIHRCHYSETGLSDIMPGDVYKTVWEAFG